MGQSAFLETPAVFLQQRPIVTARERAKWGVFRSDELRTAWINALIAGKADAEIGP
jgi:hypothetical protein